MKRRGWWVLLALCSVAVNPAAGQGKLQALVSTTPGMPMSEFRDGQLVGGIIHDLFQKLGQAVHAEVVLVSYPRKRIERAAIEAGGDLLCHVSPVWTASPEAYVWSEPLYEHKEVVFGRRGVPKVAGLDELPSRTKVATVLGYVYPLIDNYFAGGRLVREDVLDEYKVLQKVAAGRNDYGITSLPTLNWYRRHTPQRAIADWEREVASLPIHCLVSRKSAWPPEVITGALHQLKKSGEIDRILRSYQ